MEDVEEVLSKAMQDPEQESDGDEPDNLDEICELRSFLRLNELSFRARIIYELHHAAGKDDIFVPSYRTVRAEVAWLDELCAPWETKKYGKYCFIEVPGENTIQRAFEKLMLEKYLDGADLTTHDKVKGFFPGCSKEQLISNLETSMQVLMLPLADLAKMDTSIVIDHF